MLPVSVVCSREITPRNGAPGNMTSHLGGDKENW